MIGSLVQEGHHDKPGCSGASDGQQHSAHQGGGCQMMLHVAPQREVQHLGPVFQGVELPLGLLQQRGVIPEAHDSTHFNVRLQMSVHSPSKGEVLCG